jgi:Domain of unknown function (DUF6968)
MRRTVAKQGRRTAVQRLWSPTELGHEIATRRLSFKPRRGRRHDVVVRIGQPVREPKATSRDPWWCPFEVVGLGPRKLSAAAGQDSVQALVLALRGIEALLVYRAQRLGGVIEWLGELERPVFAYTFFAEAYEAAIANLVEGLKLAQELIEKPGGTVRFEEQTERLRQLTDCRGFFKKARRIRLTGGKGR